MISAAAPGGYSSIRAGAAEQKIRVVRALSSSGRRVPTGNGGPSRLQLETTVPASSSANSTSPAKSASRR
jgi:hypothetical protein